MIEVDTFSKYVKHYQILFYDSDNLIQKDNIEYYTCPICLYLLKNPINCSEAENSHSFCSECILKYMIQNYNYNCPTCKQIFQCKIKNDLIESLNKLSFNCCFKKEGCNKIILYSDYLNHINNCEYNNVYECHIKKYNYKRKEFEICGIKDNKINIENHLKSCAFMKFNCVFCNENILQKDLEEHVQNKCKFKIINYLNKGKYLGENKNNIRNGYGILYYNDGSRYYGEWKNNNKEGYGICYFYSRNKYEGEWKNDKMEGYGIYYYNNGNRLEGEWKNNEFFGNGKMYDYNNNIIFEVELKDNQRNGYIIKYFIDGKYEGEIKNFKIEGYGILYINNIIAYQGGWKNNLNEGYGIYNYNDGSRYEGEWKQSMKNGFGIYYYTNGTKYEGEWKDNIIEGYGTFYYSNGLIIKGNFKDNRESGLGKIYNNHNKIIYEGELKDGQFDGYGINIILMVYIKANLKMIKEKDMECFIFIMEINMKVDGKMT